jgi:hypothetical protein
MYLSVQLTGEEIQGYELDGDLLFNGQRERAAIEFAVGLKDRHPRNTVAIVVLSEAPRDEEEESMTVITTAKVTDEEIAKTVANIERSLNEWEEGRMTSPDDRDHLIAACEALGVDWQDHTETVDEIANEIHEDAGREITDVESLAKYALTRLKEEGVGAPDEDEPKSEYLVHINIQLPREKRIEVEQLQREISGALEVGLGSEEYAPGLQGAEVEIALAEEIG